jgi:Cys-tRNA(Pro)/Cys-tRNA(Cys) deacylase
LHRDGGRDTAVRHGTVRRCVRPERGHRKENNRKGRWFTKSVRIRTVLVERSCHRCDGMKTNAVRLLEERGVAHELRAYEVDPDDLTAQTVADKIGLPAEQVFKTLVARGDRHGVCFAVVPGNCRLDLKALAKLTGDRKVETVPLKEVQPLTGYVRGGVTVPGAKKAYPVYVDEAIELFEVVSISAGMRGLQILLAPAEYLRATGARLGPIAAAE